MRTEGWVLICLGLTFAGLAVGCQQLRARALMLLATMLATLSLLLGVVVLGFGEMY